MGMFCCTPGENYLKKYSKKIMLCSEVLSPENLVQNKVFLYDVEYQIAFSIKMDFKVIQSLEGLSQLNLNDLLYFCGASKHQEMGGSLFFCFNPYRSKVNVLINSIYYHYNPTMATYGNNTILVLSGLNSRKCELYNIDISKWKYLPDLPDERYGSSALADSLNDIVYLFGGMSKTQKRNYSVLKLDLSSCSCWDELFIRGMENSFSRSFSTIIDSNSHIYIIGGQDNVNDSLTDEILEVDIENEVIVNKFHAMKPLKFEKIRNGVDLNKSTFFNISDEFTIIKLEMNGFKFSEYDLFKQEAN